MKILVIDSFLNTLKFTLFEMDNEKVICFGSFERIGLEGSFYTIFRGEDKITEEIVIENYRDASVLLSQKLLNLEIIGSYFDIKAIGYRILQGKDVFDKSCFLDDSSLKELEEIDVDQSKLQPVLESIYAFHDVFSQAEMIGVFETAFSLTMEEKNFLYPIPYEWYKLYKIRKYGAQGITHKVVLRDISKFLKKDNCKIISCDLDEDGSICAIDNQKCIDISTGFSSLSGILSGRKSGDIDPFIIPYIMEKEGKNVGEVLDDLVNRSGLLGLSETSGDILEISSSDSFKSIFALDYYVKNIVEKIAQYYVLLEKVDALVFTGKVLVNNSFIRGEIIKKLKPLGIIIDSNLNETIDSSGKISSEDSSILVYVNSVSLELEIAKEVFQLMNR